MARNKSRFFYVVTEYHTVANTYTESIIYTDYNGKYLNYKEFCKQLKERHPQCVGKPLILNIIEMSKRDYEEYTKEK